MTTNTESALVERYKANYYMEESVDLTYADAMKHWELEKQLAQQLMASTPENRWDVFESAYSRLYSELPWLNDHGERTDEAVTDQGFAIWQTLIGKKSQSVFEIGSGKGELIEFLARQGHQCRATEITRERGEKYTSQFDNLTWETTDGIHLDHFESTDTYDVAISNQVIEHMHPDDLPEHLAGVAAILKNDGRYIFSTPHHFFGPSDISRVFGMDEAKGMHLIEYRYREMIPHLKATGFTKISAVWRIPPKLSSKLPWEPTPRASRLFLVYVRTMERLLGLVRSPSIRRRLAYKMRFAFFPRDIFLVATVKK